MIEPQPRVECQLAGHLKLVFEEGARRQAPPNRVSAQCGPIGVYRRHLAALAIDRSQEPASQDVGVVKFKSAFDLRS